MKSLRSAAACRPFLTAMVLLGLCAGPACADVYKWVDAQGHTHYSDLPPDDGSKAKVIGAPVSAAVRPAGGKDEAPSGMPDGSKGSASDVAAAAAAAKASSAAAEVSKAGAGGIKPGTVLNAEDPAAAQRRAENCVRARTELELLQSNNRVFTTDAKGMRNYVDDDSRAARAAELQRQLPVECN